jgi:tetratricopeptide (TPR) repeat protein
LQSYERALQLFTEVKAKLGQANVLKAIGDVQSFRKEMDAALQSYERALQLFTEVKAKLGQANVYLALGQLKDNPGDFERAIQLYEQIRDGYSIARGKFYYAISLAESGEIERAKLLLAEARPLWAAIQFDQGVQLIDGQLAQLADGS